MTLSLAGKNVAIIVANGFDENQMTEIQRALTKARATLKTIAPETGVVNGWQGAGWGHYFPIDMQITEALGSDFDALVLPGGERGIAKLKANLHTRRIVNHFMEAGKPIAAIASGVGLLALSPKISGHLVAASADVQAELENAGADISGDPQVQVANLLTASGEDNAIWIEAALTFFNEAEALEIAA